MYSENHKMELKDDLYTQVMSMNMRQRSFEV